jgi:hypothetical protein
MSSPSSVPLVKVRPVWPGEMPKLPHEVVCEGQFLFKRNRRSNPLPPPGVCKPADAQTGSGGSPAVEEVACAVLAGARIVVAVEEGALLCIKQSGGQIH